MEKQVLNLIFLPVSLKRKEFLIKIISLLIAQYNGNQKTNEFIFGWRSEGSGLEKRCEINVNSLSLSFLLNQLMKELNELQKKTFN